MKHSVLQHPPLEKSGRGSVTDSIKKQIICFYEHKRQPNSIGTVSYTRNVRKLGMELNFGPTPDFRMDFLQ